MPLVNTVVTLNHWFCRYFASGLLCAKRSKKAQATFDSQAPDMGLKDLKKQLFKHLFISTIVASAGLLTSFDVNAQLFPNLGGQRVGIAGMPFLKNDLSPRSMAMGGANVSLSGDIYAAVNNIALADEVKHPTAGISNTNFVGLNHAYGAILYPMKDAGTFSLSVHNLSAGLMDVRTEFRPDGTGARFATTNSAFGLGYAKHLSDMFSFGVNAKFMYEAVAEYSALAVAADVGFLYKTDWRNLRFAATLQHFGTNTTFSGTAFREPFNRNRQEAETFPSPITFKMGASVDAIDADGHKLVVAAQLYHPSDNAENVRVGLEYSFRDMFFARGGYRLNVPNETLPSFGVGFKYDKNRYPVQIDLGAQPSNMLGMIWTAGLSIGLNRTETDQTIGNQ